MDDKIRNLLDYIYKYESGSNYDQWNHKTELRPDVPLTSMTVNEVLDWQQANNQLPKGRRFTAAGAVQIVRETLAEEVRKGTVAAEDMFDAATQDKLAMSLLKKRGLDGWIDGTLSTQEFGTRLAKEWAALPVLQDTYRDKTFIRRGSGYYGGVSTNPSNVAAKADEFEALLDNGTMPASTPRTSTQSRRVVSDPLDMAGAQMRPNAGFWLDEQNARTKPSDAELPPWREAMPELASGLDSNPLTGFTADTAPLSPARPYGTRMASEESPIVHPGWTTAFTDEWTDSFIVRGIKNQIARNRYEQDETFFGAAQAMVDGYKENGEIRFLNAARNKEHYDFLKTQLEAEKERGQRREVSDYHLAEFFGVMSNPDSLVLLGVPLGVGASALRGAGSNFARVGARSALATGASEAAMESGRRAYDPYASVEGSLARVGIATAFGGILGGGVGVWAGSKMRTQMVEGIVGDIARARGIGENFAEIKVGNGAKAPVRYLDESEMTIKPLVGTRGVAVHNGEAVVDEATILQRMKDGDVPDGVKTPNELVQYELARAQALHESGAAKMVEDALGNSGKTSDELISALPEEVQKSVVSQAKDLAAALKGLPPDIAKAVGKEQVELAAAQVAKESGKEAAEAFSRLADDLLGIPNEATTVSIPLRGQVLAGYGPKTKAIPSMKTTEAKLFKDAIDAADGEAVEAVLSYRAKNNKILQDARLAAMARLAPSPFKTIHAEGLATETRDLVDLLVADGAFAQKAFETGLSVGPSVYSRVKTWDGVVSTLIDRENEVYQRYLGYSKNPEIGGIHINKSFRQRRADGQKAMSVQEFRDAASKVLITGQKHTVNEVNEMAENIRAAYSEYKIAAEEHGILGGVNSLKKQLGKARAQKHMAEEKGDEALAARYQTNIEAITHLQRLAQEGPGEEYFTRIYSLRAIAENREAFKRQIVMPWMEKQPYFHIWEEGKLGLRLQQEELQSAYHAALQEKNAARAELIGKQLDEIGKRIEKAPSEAGWYAHKGQTTPAALSKRADDLIDQILGEAEPADLATFRDPHRPTFGRSRQFNIPNSFLLKDGPNGNGIADFISTDYAMNMKLYNDRMAPAIEMSRSFGSPGDGIGWSRGFEERLAVTEVAEKNAWTAKHGTEDGFEAHWNKMSMNFNHLKDRVTNRVIKDPNRWDNRAASVLRDWATVTLMGMSALSSVQELGMLVMRHGLGNTFRSAFRDLDTALGQAMQAGVVEGRKAGAIMDVHMGTALAGFGETGFDANLTSVFERGLKTFANKYFVLNGLGSATSALKQMDLALRVPATVEKIVMVAEGTATKAEIAELARFGISKADAIRMAKQPIYEKDGHWFANTDAWGDEGLARTFKAAIRQGNENTILTATAADKPIISEGTIYLRSNKTIGEMAKKMGWEEQGGYVKVQSGLMSLPFTFWNYAIAAQNKILLAGLDEPTARKMSGVAVLVGMGYMVAQIKTGQEKWDKMSEDQKMRKAIDQSGILGAIGSMTNIIQDTAIGATGVNPFPFPTKNGYQPGFGDAAFALAGAGPAVARNAIVGIGTGDAETASWALPLRNHLLMKWMFDAVFDGQQRTYSGG